MSSNLPEWEQLLNILFEGAIIGAVIFGLLQLEQKWKARKARRKEGA